MSFVNYYELGELDKALSLFTKGNDDICLCKAFNNACENRYLNVARFLLAVNSDINISAKHEYIFRFACQHGHLDVAQWLLTVKPDINIAAEHEFAFREACENGHLEVAQWLLSVKSDINISIEQD